MREIAIYDTRVVHSLKFHRQTACHLGEVELATLFNGFYVVNHSQYLCSSSDVLNHVQFRVGDFPRPIRFVDDMFLC